MINNFKQFENKITRGSAVFLYCNKYKIPIVGGQRHNYHRNDNIFTDYEINLEVLVAPDEYDYLWKQGGKKVRIYYEGIIGEGPMEIMSHKPIINENSNLTSMLYLKFMFLHENMIKIDRNITIVTRFDLMDIEND